MQGNRTLESIPNYFDTAITLIGKFVTPLNMVGANHMAFTGVFGTQNVLETRSSSGVGANRSLPILAKRGVR